MGAPLKSRETYNNMCSKGFRPSTSTNKDHIRIEFWHNDKLTPFKTKFSHNGQELDDYLLGKMSKQIGLGKKEFIEFAKCTLTEPEYVAKLQEQKRL
jgi:hypothetical protein